MIGWGAVIGRCLETDTGFFVFFLAATIAAETHSNSTNNTLNTSVYQEGNPYPIFDIVDMNVDFAPNTVFPLTMLDREGFGLFAGNYRAIITLEHEGQTWRFEEDFVITNTQALAINDEALNRDRQGAPIAPQSGIAGLAITEVPIWLLIAVALTLVTAFIIFYIKQKEKSRRDFQRVIEQLGTRNS